MTIAEIVTCRLKPGASDAAYLAVARKADTFLQSCQGFTQRRLSKAEDGTWTDWLEWQSLADAEAASQAFMSQPCMGEIMALADETTLIMRHEPILLAT